MMANNLFASALRGILRSLRVEKSRKTSFYFSDSDITTTYSAPGVRENIDASRPKDLREKQRNDG